MSAPPALERPLEAPGIPAGVVLLLGALTALGPLAIDMYLPAFPAIAHGLGTNLGEVQFTLSVFFAGIALSQALYGPVADRWGRRVPLLVGTVIFTVASVGCALAGSIGELALWRLAMAVGGAAGMVIAKAVVRDRCDTLGMAKMLSLLMLIMGAAPVLAPSIGGVLLETTGWRGIFWSMALFGAFCTVGAFFGLRETLAPEHRAAAGVMPAVRTYRRLLTDRWFVLHCLIAGAVSGALFGYVSGAPTIFSEHLQLSPRAFSVVFGLNAVALIGAAQVNRLLLRHASPRLLMLAACAVLTLATSLLLLAAWLGFDNLLVTEVCVFLTLGSIGIILPNIGALVMMPFAHVAGSAGALQGSIQFGMGAVVGAANGYLHNGTTVPPAVLLAGSSLVTLLLAWRTRHWASGA